MPPLSLAQTQGPSFSHLCNSILYSILLSGSFPSCSAGNCCSLETQFKHLSPPDPPLLCKLPHYLTSAFTLVSVSLPTVIAGLFSLLIPPGLRPESLLILVPLASGSQEEPINVYLVNQLSSKPLFPFLPFHSSFDLRILHSPISWVKDIQETRFPWPQWWPNREPAIQLPLQVGVNFRASR